MSEFLKCDAEGCDHREDVEHITDELVGKPCPKCGANLLTQDDWDFYSTVMRPGMDLMESLGLPVRATAETPPDQKAQFNYHDGEIRITLPKSAA